MAEVTLNFGTLISPEKFNGESCSMCKDLIYGDGFKLVLTVKTAQDLLPDFKETEIKLCSSCNDFMKW